MTDYRQGQGAFGGDVRPGGDVLLLHEEFESGKPTGGRPFGPAGTPAAQLQDRWLPWNEGLLPADVVRWIDPIAQRFSLYGPAPAEVVETATAQWVGNLLRFPAPEVYLGPTPLEDGVRLAYLSVFAGVSIGPGQMLFNEITNNKTISYAALVLAATDLLLADGAFVAAGVRQESDPAGTIILGQPFRWQSRAFVGQFPGAQQLPSNEDNYVLNSMGLLVRMELQIEAETEGGETIAETEIIVSVSNDGGRGWTTVGVEEIKGDPDGFNVPRVIGFGATSTEDPGSSQVTGIPSTGGFDFLRVYRRPVDEWSVAINPDGGRNWP